jgi:hypothetical protein
MRAAVLITCALIAYAGLCWLLPFSRCHACHATGTRRRLLSRRLRPCRCCRGTGRRLRYGRRATNYAVRIHHAARTRPTQPTSSGASMSGPRR